MSSNQETVSTLLNGSSSSGANFRKIVDYENVEYETYRFCIKRRARGDNLKKSRMLYAFVPDRVVKSNKVETSKYTVLNFLPKMLSYQFSKLANVYFFIIGLMQCVKSISISDGKPVMFLPFSFILGVSAVKELLEDMKRHKQDRIENRKLVTMIDKTQFIQIQSQEIYIGHVIKVEKNQQIPADIVVLKSSDKNGICFVETMNLDGETNLKQKSSVKEVQVLNLDQMESGIQVTYEAPNRYLYGFNGKISYLNQFEQALSASNVLLKGSELRNTDYVYGLVVYTGPETKIMMNSIDPSPKLSSLERQMNKLILILFSIQLLVCLFSADLAYIMMQTKLDSLDYLFHHDPQRTQEIEHDMLSFIMVKWGTWVLIFTNFIPISLLVTLELVKFYQGLLVQNDTKFYNNVSVQSSSLNEELGQVNHIFSDKTGTLTKNKMEFKQICIAGINYGDINASGSFEKNQLVLPVKREPNVDFEDMVFFEALQNKDKSVWEALYCLALCHNVIAEQPDVDDEVKEITFSAASPDELALVSFAKFAGLAFTGSEIIQNNCFYHLRNNYEHSDLSYEVLNVFEFDSTRKRFTIIIKDQSNKITMYMKGADNIVEALLRSPVDAENEILQQTKKVTNQYAMIGLRTLFLAKRELDVSFYEDWAKQYSAASREMENRDKKMEKVRLLIEQDMVLLGATAIEDKLQDDVGATIESFRQAGIKFWVLTGDKKETAINISTASKIIDSDTHLIDLDCATSEELSQNITYYRGCQQLAESNSQQKRKQSVIISGDTFLLLEKNKKLANEFVKLTLLTESMIGCRFSPKQKQSVVAMVRENTKDYPTLAIGDGANDVNMILEAHVGIGIQGVEGSQASRASDFSIGEFRQLRYLLFDFGRECYRKNSELVLYNFYKNVLLVVPQWWFGLFFNMFSGVSYYDPWLYQLYNTFYTALPIVIYAVIDRQHRQTDLIRFCDLYKAGMQYEHFNVKKYLMNLSNGAFQALVIMLCSFMILENQVLNEDEEGGNYSFFAMTGMVSFGLSVLVSNLKIATFSYAYTSYSLLFIFGSYLFYLITYFFLTEFSPTSDLYKTFSLMNSNYTIAAMYFLVAMLFFLLDLAYQRWVDFEGDVVHEQFLEEHPRMTTMNNQQQQHASFMEFDRPEIKYSKQSDFILNKQQKYEMTVFNPSSSTR